ncbi:MAG: amidohydrolase family protein [Burkholderiales bacterium]|nr:amidohydrolase family protein [Burkholderiales bacterium]
MSFLLCSLRLLRRAAGIGGFIATAAGAAPQLVLVNADIFTADPAQPRAQALAIEAGRIVAIGRNEKIRALVGPQTRVADAGGRLVTPGLIESHAHVGWDLPTPALALPGDQFRGPGADQVLAAVERAARTQRDWISAWIGVIAARDKRNWREALDKVAPSTPVLLRGFWGHTTIVNSEALRRLSISEDVVDPLGGWWGRDAAGKLNGRVYEAAEDLEQRIAEPSAQRMAPIFAASARRYAHWGVTSIHLMSSMMPLSTTIDTLRRASTPQRWTVYSWAGPVARVSEGWSQIDAAQRTRLPDRIRVGGINWALDGTSLEQMARRRDAYIGRPDWFGRSNYSDAALREILRAALRSPHQLSLHVVGDGETERLLAAMRELAPASVWRDKRVRMERGDGIRADLLESVSEFGVVVVINPTHLPPPTADGGPPAPPSRLALMRSLEDGGVPIAMGSDAAGDQANPFFNMMIACSYGASPGEALTREHALRAYTSGAAYAERGEKGKGRLAPGMAADLAVLSQNVLTVPLAILPSTVSVLTLVDGKVIHDELRQQAKR